MGEVYRATDTRLGREVAIKVLPPELAADPERRARFEQEAAVVAALNHPNIVTLHSVEEDAGVHFITMELVEGRTLSDVHPSPTASRSRSYPRGSRSRSPTRSAAPTRRASSTATSSRRT